MRASNNRYCLDTAKYTNYSPTQHLTAADAKSKFLLDIADKTINNIITLSDNIVL